ncbi:hypothetical protein ACQJBY_029662 [Aegilops geniculata]
MASANHGGTGRRKPSVWNDFHRVIVSGAAGACAMATCNRCGTTLHAGSKKHGTSHLRRHANSSCCAKRAAERDAKWADELLVEPAEFDLAGRLIIEGEPVDVGARVAAAGDDGRLSPNLIPDALPQASSSSSTRFFQKKRERFANLASHEGETTGDDDHSSHAKDWVPTVVDDNFLLDMDFTFEDWE